MLIVIYMRVTKKKRKKNNSDAPHIRLTHIYILANARFESAACIVYYI